LKLNNKHKKKSLNKNKLQPTHTTKISLVA